MTTKLELELLVPHVLLCESFIKIGSSGCVAPEGRQNMKNCLLSSTIHAKFHQNWYSFLIMLCGRVLIYSALILIFSQNKAV